MDFRKNCWKGNCHTGTCFLIARPGMEMATKPPHIMISARSTVLKAGSANRIRGSVGDACPGLRGGLNACLSGLCQVDVWVT